MEFYPYRNTIHRILKLYTLLLKLCSSTEFLHFLFSRILQTTYNGTFCMIDDTTYDTVFQTTHGDALIVRVHMPADTNGSSSSTCKAPAMSMAGIRARHPWLDSRMRIVGYSDIRSDDVWRNSRKTLGQAVHDVVKHLQLNPPEVLEIVDPGLLAIQTKNNYKQQQQQNKNTYGSGRAGSNSNDDDDAPPDYSTVLNMPDIPSQFDELDQLSREDLEELLEDELEFLAFVNKLPVFQKIQSTADDILEENVTMAKANLEKEEQINTLHKEVTDLKSQLEAKINKFQQLERKQDSICAPPDVKDALRQLNRAKKEAFEESEQLADEWVEEGDDVGKFVKNFMEKRKVHHLRAAKMERLQIALGHSRHKSLS